MRERERKNTKNLTIKRPSESSHTNQSSSWREDSGGGRAGSASGGTRNSLRNIWRDESESDEQVRYRPQHREEDRVNELRSRALSSKKRSSSLRHSAEERERRSVSKSHVNYDPSESDSELTLELKKRQQRRKPAEKSSSDKTTKTAISSRRQVSEVDVDDEMEDDSVAPDPPPPPSTLNPRPSSSQSQPHEEEQDDDENDPGSVTSGTSSLTGGKRVQYDRLHKIYERITGIKS